MAKKKTLAGNAPQVIHELVAKFDEHQEVYPRGDYNETMLRRDFLDPFFAAMGWDIDNRKGYSEAYRGVIHEDSLRVEKSVKAPDYCFRIGGHRKFFVEAKKPSVNIKDDVSPAFQLRRYAWTAKLPLSILADFEELAVYDCRIKPDKADKASVARVMFLKYTEYVERWEELAAIFSPDAINKGSFDKYAKSQKKKRGTAEVDEAFLVEIEEWRESLAKNLSLRNQSLTDRELNFSVQRIIDRIIFLRMCEGRGIEPYGRLQALLNGTGSYGRLVEMFHRADEKYNSGLFHFHKEKGREPPDTLTTALVVDDKVLKDIVRRLYFPDSPYEFAALPADILGQVYEQFLGKVIRLTKGHRAKIEEKPEVRKAGGVYYTPTYIVDYIVENTVVKLLEGKTPQEVGGLTKTYQVSKRGRPLAVLDPACGSGSFLIVAYQNLLDWYLKQYTEVDKPTKHDKGKNPRLCQSGKGEWRLTMSERKRILLSHIYGVDIDFQAVEVTKLSLLLKVLEGETQDSLQRQLVAFHKDRALPDLANNIKCGNSLIGPDFYLGQQLDLFDEAERLRVNVFDWQNEFSYVFSGKNPGFDAVIGNPPWGGDIDRELPYYHRRYPSSTRDHTDSFKLFVDKGIQLLSARGMVAMIVPSTLMRQRRFLDIRTLTLQKTILALSNLGEDVFRGVVAPSCIFVIRNASPTARHTVSLLDASRAPLADKPSLLIDSSQRIRLPQRPLLTNPDREFGVSIRPTRVSCRRLGEFENLQCKDAGINYQRVGVGMRVKGNSDLSARLLYEGKQESPKHEMFWKGEDIGRYWISPVTKRFCRPETASNLRKNEVVRLAVSTYRHVPKIVFRQTADRIIAAKDDRGIWFGRSIITLIEVSPTEYDLDYFLALLNSRYFTWMYQQLTKESGRVFAQVKKSKVLQLWIRTIDFAGAADKRRHDSLASLANDIAKLIATKDIRRSPQERTALERQIEATDREVDQLVYNLYGLTDKEIRIVEESTTK